MLKKLISLIIIILLIPFTLTGCYDASAIEKLAYVVAIGLDVGETDSLKLTLQFASSSSSSGGSSSQSQDTINTSIDCSSIDSGIAMVNSYISKKIDLSHCKIVVFSEQLAEQGIKEYLTSLSNSVEIRPDCDIIVTRCDASDFINNSKPSLTNLTARYYEVLLNSQEYTGYTIESPIFKFMSAIHSKLIQPVAVLGGLNLPETHSQNSNINIADSDYYYKAGETPIDNPTKVQNLGMAVFYEDKLIGELSGIECVCYSILNNTLKGTTINIPNPFEQEEIINLSVILDKDTKNTVELINSTPYITCNVHLKATIQSFGNNSDYSKDENIKVIEDYLSSYIKAHILDYLYKTSKEFHSDITGFGKNAVHKYLTMDKWDESDWLNNYKNSIFSVNVDSSIAGSYLFLKH